MNYFFYIVESLTYKQSDVINLDTVIWRIIIFFTFYRRVTLISKLFFYSTKDNIRVMLTCLYFEEWLNIES